MKHEVRQQFGIGEISTDFLRAPIEELATSRTLPVKQPVDLLAVKVTQPWNKLNPEIRRKLRVFGIDRKNRNAVVIDDPAIRKHLRSVGADVQMKEFSTNLPLKSEIEGFDLLER